MRIFYTTAALVMLSGCASQSAVLSLKKPVPVPTPYTEQQAIPLAKMDIKDDVDSAQFPAPQPTEAWTAMGKFSVKMTDADGSKKGGSAYFVWQQLMTDYRITLSGPLGQGRTVLNGSTDNISIDSEKTGYLEADTPEALFEQAFGWTAPVSYLRQWLNGKPATAHPEDIYAENGTLQSSQEGAWQADFKNYRYVNNAFLPQKIIITGPNLTMTVLVSDWKPQAEKW
ncbi:lipoprotein insertase outer membrane protein LolB [Agitococcus lubricus]|uniref:Outer-membrane lipoprotein LolB n=1 Tax=Agitococcus lubricus TaxID=1077255 RepID=A0A2T5ITR2_9GAMM|nr:lipoprotein insertase outer membrane protein LolB [Agitococcus lubricus]PTQ87220.1 outer membrane lipoprotein LolB [Agitococcus lubricus]